MILLLDLGNSRLKWGVLDPHGGVGETGGGWHAGKGEGAWTATLSGVVQPVNGALLASVASPQTTTALCDWIRRQWRCPITQVQTDAEAHGVRNGYREPARLGVDRWLALLGARQRLAGPVCVVDAGTAITVDVMDHEGRHQGGLITPGLRLMAAALGRGTAAVRPGTLNIGDSPQRFGTETDTCVLQGVVTAAVGLVERAWRDYESALGAPVTCVLTGGDAPRLLPNLPASCIHEPELVLSGLAQYAL